RGGPGHGRMARGEHARGRRDGSQDGAPLWGATVTVSLQREDAEGLRVGRADLRACLLGFPRQPLLEKADAVPADLARVLGEGRALRREESGDVLVMRRLVRPADPHVSDVA